MSPATETLLEELRAEGWIVHPYEGDLARLPGVRHRWNIYGRRDPRGRFHRGYLYGVLLERHDGTTVELWPYEKERRNRRAGKRTTADTFERDIACDFDNADELLEESWLFWEVGVSRRAFRWLIHGLGLRARQVDGMFYYTQDDYDLLLYACGRLNEGKTPLKAIAETFRAENPGARLSLPASGTPQEAP